MLIRTGDTVEVRSGNSRGTRARVLSVDSANGKLVVEIEIGSAEWVALHGASKFKKRPTFGTKKGRIMLQDHGGKVWFRNLKIREL